MALKKKKQKKKQERKPALKPRGKLFILDGRTPLAKTAMNRDIPLVMGGGGSPNLMSALAGQQLRQVQVPQQVQTPDAFKAQQDIRDIKSAQVNIAEELLAQRRNEDARIRGARINQPDEKYSGDLIIPSYRRRMQPPPQMYGQEINTGPAPIVRPPREVKAPMRIQPNPFDTYDVNDDKITIRELPAPPVNFNQSLVGMDGGGIFGGQGVGAGSAKPIDIDAEWEYFQRTGKMFGEE